MWCHYCDRDASFAPELNGVRVGLCDTHFREQFEYLAETDALAFCGDARAVAGVPAVSRNRWRD